MPVVTIDCPYCMSRHTSFEVMISKIAERPEVSGKPEDTTHEAVGRCGACHSYVALFFQVLRGLGPKKGPLERFPDGLGCINDYVDRKKSIGIRLLGQRPAPPRPECPEFAPENVEWAFIEAEKARLAGTFGAAAAQYGKAVERAVTPFVDEKFKNKMLGQKLGNLEDKGLLPEAMLEWIRVVKDDRNFALHAKDRDFKKAEEIDPARDFARTLITYLYTLPKRVETARESIEKRKS